MHRQSKHALCRKGGCIMQTDNQLKIAVCDDVRSDLLEITVMTKEILQDAGITHSIVGYESGNELLQDIQNGAKFHILLLDVVMDELDGMELAAQLRKQQNKTAIVFISINREMALRGYEVSAARYLAKPLEKGKLKEALDHCFEDWQAQKEILLPTERGQYRISLSDIQFVEAFDRGTRFVLADEKVECRLKFGEVEAMLPSSSFIRCHRSFLVNLSGIRSIRPYEFSLKSGQAVPISKGRFSEIHKKFVDYLAD